MTNFDTLAQLISKYNHAAHAFNWKPVDGALVDIRDALAHGRVAYSGDEEHYARLMKFDKPRHGKVRVCFNAELSPDWFDQQIRATKRALDSVEEASHALQEHKAHSQTKELKAATHPHDEGHHAYRHRLLRDRNPYREGTWQNEEWDDGWKHGEECDELDSYNWITGQFK